MAGITPSQFRLGPDTLADLDSLAANNGGQRTTAVKESVAQFLALVEEAGRENADDLDEHDWLRLAHLNDPDPMGGLIEDEESLTLHGRDWSQWLAAEVLGAYEGIELVLPVHKFEAKEHEKLARRIAKFGRLRGYALMCALRYFWRQKDAGIGACAAPEVWLTPTARQ